MFPNTDETIFRQMLSKDINPLVIRVFTTYSLNNETNNLVIVVLEMRPITSNLSFFLGLTIGNESFFDQL